MSSLSQQRNLSGIDWFLLIIIRKQFIFNLKLFTTVHIGSGVRWREAAHARNSDTSDHFSAAPPKRYKTLVQTEVDQK